MKTTALRSRFKSFQTIYTAIADKIWNQAPIELIVAGCLMIPMGFVLLGLGKLLSLIAIPVSIGWGGFLIGTALFRLILGLLKIEL